jgi:uncharacterized protein YkwD
MRKGGTSVCVVVLLSLSAASIASARTAAAKRPLLTSREASLVVAINAVRTLHFLPKLHVDVRLTRAARSHSRDMLQRDYFAHGDFGGRMAQFRVRGNYFAENLVWSTGVMSANNAVSEWLASPPHRQNLLDPKLRRIGVGTPVGNFSGYSPATMVTADFAG